MRLFPVLLFLALSTPFFAQKTTPQRTYELKEALEKKLVSLNIEGVGGHRGETIQMTLKNLAGRYLRVMIPLGQLMEPADPGMQTLVNASEQTVSVNVKTPGEVKLKTFCTESGERSPSAGIGFAVGSLASAELCGLLKYLAENGKTDDPEAQSAVWCVMDGGQSLSSIGDKDIKKFTADLLGKTIPPYTIRHQAVEDVPGRSAQLGKALVVEANFQYTLEKDDKIIMLLLDGEEKLIKQISKEESRKAGEYRSGIHLEVYNLDPGKYIVRMQTKAGRVLKDMPIEF